MKRLNNLEGIYTINYVQLIRFIETNSNMDWNTVCDFVNKHPFGHFSDITQVYFKSDFKTFNENDILFELEVDRWMHEFFKAHPELPEKIAILFA